MRIVIIVLLVLLVIGGYAMYQHHESLTANGDGTVTVQNSGSSDKSASTDLDGRPIASHEPTDDSQGIGSGRSTNQPPATMASTTTSTDTLYTSNGTAATAIPASDSQASNAPDNYHFAGSGQYQWYRQGDITYRIDTGTGATCIDFATMDQWRRPDVYRHGCHKS